MSKETVTSKGENKEFPENGVPIFVPWKQEKETVIVCDMCGHKNPEHTAMCEMCSNYLK